MQKQRLHGHDPSTRRRAGYFTTELAERDLFGAWQPPRTMGARNDAERAVVRTTVVDVEANRHQVVQQDRRRLHEQGPFLLRPALEVWMEDSLSNGNAEVLVDGNQPVHSGRLVEIGALDRNGSGKKRTQWLGAAERLGDRTTPSGIEKIARASSVVAKTSEVSFDDLALSFWQNAREHNEAV